jgi:hypothetical protein
MAQPQVVLRDDARPTPPKPARAPTASSISLPEASAEGGGGWFTQTAAELQL